MKEAFKKLYIWFTLRFLIKKRAIFIAKTMGELSDTMDYYRYRNKYFSISYYETIYKIVSVTTPTIKEEHKLYWWSEKGKTEIASFHLQKDYNCDWVYAFNNLFNAVKKAKKMYDGIYKHELF